MADLMIDAQGVSHRYGARWALRGVDLRLAKGKILAMVGANGSGKTTLLKSLAGLIQVTSGSVKVFGMDSFSHRVAIMRHARFSFSPPSLYDSLTAYEHLMFLTRMGVAPGLRPTCKEMMGVLKLVGLADRADDKARVFSFGMRQRLALAMCLLPRPELLVLDEPMDGLDPLAMVEFSDLLRRLRENHGMSIVLTSHQLAQLEELADHLLVLHDGRVLFSGTPQEMVAKHERVVIRVNGDARQALSILQRAGRQGEIQGENRLSLVYNHLTLENARSLLDQQSIELTAFHRLRPGLDAAMLQWLRTEQSNPSVGR